MSLKTSILRSYVGPLVCALLPSSRVTALSDVPRARKRRLLSNDRFDVYLRQVALKLATLCLLACASLTSAETLVVDESNHRGWTFFANPAVTAAGEAPIVGISDHAGGAASLNFSLNAGQDKSSRNARLLKSDFPAAGLTDITTLKDLSSISWQVHHSDPGNYPKFVVWVEVPITDDGVSEPEAIYFRPQNQAVTLSEWDLVEVDLVNSKFTNNGVTTDGKKSTGTFAEWLDVIGNYDIHEIGIQYNNGNKSYVSYIDYIEINGTTFNFEASPPLPPSAPTDLVATPGDGQLTIAFTQSDDNGTAITDYQYKRDDGSWTAAGTTGSSITIPDLTNGKDYVVRLRAISAAGNGEEAQILAAPRGTSDAVTLLVTSDNLRGFRLAGFTSDYVQERDNVGIDDGFGGASINASLEGQGADQWGLFLDPAQFKGGPISQAGRKAERLQDLTSLSYRVWHDGEGYYPKLGFRMERGAPSDDGKTIAQLDLKMNQMPSLTPGWNTVEINFAQSPFAISYLSEGETSETKTLSEWIALYGDRRIQLFRWQTGRSDRETTQETYVDYIEVNGVTYDFEGTLPEVPDECSNADWAVVEASDASKQAFRCVADEADYEYADFHVLTTTGNVADICQRNLPINVNNQDNDALFCSESEGVVRAIFDWDNRSIEPGGMGIRLTWLETVSQIGSRKKGGTACGSADETVAGRCANQLAHGLRAFVDMAGAGGPAIAGLNISNLKTLFAMFAKARKFNENISDWDTSAITDMQYLFQEAKAFNQDIGNWNTGAVKNMYEMFRGASVFNGDVSRWQTGSVTNMNYMFREATAFNQNIGTWDTANVTGMFNMFHKARSFNQNIGQWDTSKVTTMHRMFDRAESFNQDLSKWDIENVTAKSDFDTGATAWCGVNFDNRGRPDGVIPWDGLDCQIKILEANASNNFFGWTFNANPDPMDAGQAPVIGIADERGGDASLNFTLAGRMGNKRSVVLRQKHFENAGIEGVTQLKHLTSISWRAHHSKALAYPRFTVTLKANPITVDGFSYKKHESLHFKRKKRLNKDQWDTVTVDFSRGDEGSLFRHSGPLDEFSPGNLSTHQDRTIEQWIAEYGELEIASIRWAYGSKDNALASTSYIDYLEINGTIFDFEEGPPQPPGPPIDVVATPEDGQVSVAFAAAMPNSEPVTRYEYQLGTQDGAGNWSEGNWTSTGGTSSPFTITDLTNGTDYRVGLRAVSNAGEGEESSVVIFAPRKATSGIGLTVRAGSPRGFSLAGWTSDYVKDRSAVGIADGLGGNASINASLTGEGGDRWGVFLNPAQYKADVKAKEEEGGAYGGRKIDRLSDLTSLSFRVNHSGNGSYPRLGIQMARNTTADDGKTIAQLDVDMSQMEPLEAGWNLVTIDFDGTPIRSSYISATESSETKTLSEWIADYGDRRINLVRWQTGSGGGATMNTTYVDQIEVNGVTYDFEGLLPLPPSAPTDLVAQPGTEAGITFTFTPGDPGDSAIIDYQYSLNGDAGSVATWTSLGNIASPYQFVVSSGLTNGREDTLFLRAVSNSGVGESATVAFRPRADLDPITLTVDSTDARGFYLSSASSDYVKERDQAGIPDKNGGTTKSLNASLSNSGDVWRAEIKAEDLNAGGRVLGKLHDIESLSYEVWHDAKGNYPQLSILIERLDGERAEALYLQVNNLPLATTNAWNTVTVDPATSLFKNNNQNNSNDANAGATYTLNQWIAFYGDRPVKRIRWGGTRSVPSTTYLDFLEINGATYDFEAVPPAVIAPPPTIQSVTAGDGQATVSFSAGNNAGATVLAYEYQKDEGEEWTFTPDGAIVAPFTISDLTNGTTYILTMRTVSAGLGDETLESEASDSVSFIPIGQPLPPTNLSAEVGDQSAIVDFDNANTGNGAEITNYLISLDGGPFVALDPAISSGPITLTDLTNNQTYSVALKTQTGSGGQALFSEPSEILSFTPESGASVPDAPIDVALTLGDQQLSVTFTPGNNNGSEITNYAYQINGGRWFDLSPASTGNSFVIAGLENGETYSVSIRAINAEGYGANSIPETATLLRSQLIIVTDDGKTIDLNITPDGDSSCSIATAVLVEAPALEDNVKLAYENMLDFTLENCNAGETVAVSITLSEDPPAEGMAYKYEYQNSQWRAIEDASISGRTISYDLKDNGPLDADPEDGKISDPVAVAVPSGKPEAPYDLVATPGNGTATVAFTAGDDGGNEITNYLYSTDAVTYIPLDPADAESPIVIPGLTNGESFSITLKAQNSEGDSPASEPEPVTLSSNCADVSDWSAAASNDEWVCQVEGQEYEYADFHVFTVVEGDSTDICKSQLPINVNNQDNDALFCEQSAGVVRAVFDWKNRSSQPDNYGARLSWLNTITQFGSRAQGNVACGAAGETVSGRCANQLADGFRAFGDMAGPGGVAIVDLDISNLTSLNAMFVRAGAFNENIGAWDTSAITDMGYIFNTAKSFNQDISGWNTGSVTRMKFMFFSAQSFNQPLAWNTSNVLDMSKMFKDARVFNQDISSWDTGNVTNMGEMFKEAKAFDQDLSGWNVKEVEDYSDFDTTTDAWCGLGFDNRGRPIGFSPTEAVGCLNVVLQAPESGSVGDEFDYVVQYYNASTTPFDNGVLTLDIPSGISIKDAGEGAVSDSNNGSQITWTNIEVPAGSSANGGGGELKVGATIGAGVTDGTELIASATLTDGAATSINDVAGTIVSAKSVLRPTIDEAAETVLPGEVIEYSLSVENVGQSPTEGGEITLTWEGDVPFTIEGKGGATCNGTSCRWVGELAPNDPRSQTVQIRIGIDAAANTTLTATLSASATNELEAADSKASATTEILALPLPELNVDVATQPQGVVDVGAQFTAFVDLSNTGNGPAGSTTVTLDIGSATYVGAAVGDEGVYANNVVTWTVSNLEPSEFKGLAVTLKAPEEVGAVRLESKVSTTTTAGDAISDRASQTLSVTGAAVLDLQLSLDPEEQLLPGDELDMAFGFQNIGNAAALDVVLATETPVDTTLLAWPNYARCGADDCSEGYVGAISLELGTVEAKERETASLSVVVNETAEAQTLSVSGSLTGTNTVGDALVPQAAAASVLVAAITEDVLAVSQRADRQTAAPGQVVVYEITYQNLSSETVTNVTLTDVLPSDTRLLNQTGGTVTIDPDTQETTWQLTTDLLAPLETGKVLLQVEVVGNAVIGTSLNNSVRLSTADSEVWADKAEVAVVANAAVLESSISNPEATAPGDSFTYALRFANTGTLAAGNTTLQLQVEDGVTVTDCDDCSKADGGRLSWSLSSIAAGKDQTKQITVLLDPSVAVNSELHAISYIGDTQNISAGVVGVSAKLQARQQRRRGGSASIKQATSAAERAGPLGMSTIRVGEKASPALGGLKMIVPDQVVAGDQVAVTVSFGNTGDAPATGVTLTSKVPANTTLTSVQGGSCSADPCIAGETLTWNVGEIAAESAREVSYILTAGSDAAGSVIGHRVVLSSEESREASVSGNTDVVAEKLSVSIAVSDAAGSDAEGSIVSVGDTITYTLTLLNESPAARSGITVVNQVPALIAACGQACIVGDSGGAAIDAEAGTLTWSNFALDAGADVALDYKVTIPPGLENDTQLVNSVSVSTATRFYDSAQSTVTVAAQAELALSMTAPNVLQDGAQGGVTLSYQNTGTAATAATLRYVLPNNATMIDSANATVSGSAYTWSLGDVAVDGVGSRAVTIEVSGAADSRLRHTASVTGTDTSAAAEATTVIGLREALALSLTAPGSVNTDAGFTASLTAQNTGNAAATATALSLTLPAGFTASAFDGGTLDSALGNQVVRWSVDLAAGASVTLSPKVTAPNAAGNATLLAGLTATSGTTQSASASVQVTMAPSAIVQAGAQFSVPEAEAGDAVTLTAGPVNIGGAASGAIANSITLAAGLSPTGYAGLQWNSTTRVLSWETPSLASRGSDLKAISLQVTDAGALTATLTSNDASGTASIVRTFPEEVAITPENPDSSCKVSGQPVVAAAPTPPEGVTLAFANTVGFTVIDCDRNPNSTYPETMVVTIDVEQAIPEGTELYKVTDAGDWKVIEDAVIGVQSVTYSITDDGDLDLDKTPGTLRDPVALAYPASKLPIVPVPLPIWLLGLAAGLIGWLGVRRLKMA